MNTVQSLVILVIAVAALAAALIVTVRSDKAEFPTKGVALLFITVLLAATPLEAVALVATA